MRVMFFTLLIIALSSPSFADEASDKKAFSKAYKSFIAAADKGEKRQARTHLKIAFEEAKKFMKADSQSFGYLSFDYGLYHASYNEMKEGADILEKHIKPNAPEWISIYAELGKLYLKKNKRRKYYTIALKKVKSFTVKTL